MPKVGDRVVVEGNKLGQPRRVGTVAGLAGSLLTVRWEDGTQSIMTPGAGAVSFESGSGNRGGAKKPAAKKAAPKAAKTSTPKAAGKKPAAAKASAVKAAGAKKTVTKPAPKKAAPKAAKKTKR